LIQINGKFRGSLKISKNIDQKSTEELIKKQEFVKKWLIGQKIKKVIFVKDKLINFLI
jgi:leucyl-tRNA synthetase